MLTVRLPTTHYVKLTTTGSGHYAKGMYPDDDDAMLTNAAYVILHPLLTCLSPRRGEGVGGKYLLYISK